MNTRPCLCDNIRRGESYRLGRDCPHCWQFHHVAAFNRAWGGDGRVVAVEKPTPAKRPGVRRGVGTHLKLILGTLGLDESTSCSCESWRAKMDAWGTAGCRRNRAAIEAHLRNEARAVGWVATLKAGTRAAAAGLIFNPIDPAPGLLDLAISRAEAEPAPAPPPAKSPNPPPGPPPAAIDFSEWGSPVIVPEPPAYTGPPGDVALVTIAANDKGRRLLDVSGPLMERYAKRIGSRFVVLDWPGPPAWPMGCKFALADVVRKHRRTVFLDADVVVLDDAINLLGQVPDDAIGGANDWPFVARTHPPFHEEYRRFLSLMGFAVPDPIPWYLNTGILVLPQSAAEFLAVPDRPIPPLWCSEQHLWNARFHMSGQPVHVLPPRCNYQWWAHEPLFWQSAPNKPGGFLPPPGAILHFSGITDTSEKLRKMKEWAKR